MIVTIHYNEGLDLDSEQFTGVQAIMHSKDRTVHIHCMSLMGAAHTYIRKIEDISHIEIF